ncbi:hypothetical protein EW145_g1203 [Phellinidium pouzarii]|uniref:SET domain-containing protein n=1 Tax=Phellinidium pouzarii TaxID=167371 RepID=A0A4S4LFK6_9AGAM|nr:hypothetical protein EW145_g1203 [Phellinidium pouzarii]
MTFMEVDKDDICWNSQIQRGKEKETAVLKGEHGLGLFITEKVCDGDLIAEYIGEMIFEPTVTCRKYVLCHDSTIDASPIGNVTRFINHAKRKKTNCEALCRLVNGEQRIGIFAIIRMHSFLKPKT